tara:strand:- start:82 stop:1302 length:1221 start_codon:yes stop_codon:yes gene_type:complete
MSTSISATEIGLPDNVKLKLGTGDDAEIFHNGTDTRIVNTTGDLSIRGGVIKLASTTGEEYFRGTADGAADLFHDNVVKLSTNSDGYRSNDNVKAQFGNSSDLQIFHDGTGCNIRSTSAKLEIRSPELILQNSGAEKYFRGLSDGAVELYYDNTKKFETTSDGVKLASLLDIKPSTYTNIEDNSAYGLNIKHVNEKPINIATGGDYIQIYDLTSSKLYIRCEHDAGVKLYNNNSTKLETISTGLNVTGGVRLGGNNSANELDDYEQGTFTPIMADNVSSGSATSYDHQSGHYTKIGNIVHIIGSLRATDKSNLNSSGTVCVRGLPFTVSDVTAGGGEPDMFAVTFINNLTNVSRGFIYGRFENGASAAQLGYPTTTGQFASNLTLGQLGSGGNTFFSFSGTYRTGS